MVRPSFLMFRSVFFLLITMSAALVCGCATTVSGRLEGPELGSEALFDARVNVTRLDASVDKDEPASLILVPDPDGTFESSEDLPKGKYLIEALVPGYEPVSVRLDLIKSQTVKLVLKPLGQARARTSEINSDPAASRGEGGALLTLPQF